MYFEFEFINILFTLDIIFKSNLYCYPVTIKYMNKKFLYYRYIFLKKASLYLILTFMMSGSSYSQNYWSIIPGPTSKTLTNCFFINPSTGWISGDSGTIIHTTNSGNNWEIQNSGTFNNIESIFFLNERLGWALTYNVFPDSTGFQGTEILTTVNGGNNWNSSLFPDTNMFMKTVFFLDSLKGFMGGISAAIVMTTNAGISWTYTDTDSTLLFILPVFNIKFFDNNLGYACGGFRDIAGITWVTTNGGFNWKGTVLAPEPFFDLTILNNQNTICAGGDLEYGSSIASTTNMGNTWYYDTLGVFGLATGIDHRTPSEIWMAASYAGKFIYSADTGITWTPIETPGNTAVFDIDFADTSIGFACGVNGSILKYDKTSSPVINNSVVVSNSDFELLQNYPNPFNPKTIIRYSLFENKFITLKIFDVLGNEVASLVNEKQKAGSYTVNFEGTNYPSGIYFYKITSDEYSVTKRMLLIK